MIICKLRAGDVISCREVVIRGMGALGRYRAGYGTLLVVYAQVMEYHLSTYKV